MHDDLRALVRCSSAACDRKVTPADFCRTCCVRVCRKCIGSHHCTDIALKTSACITAGNKFFAIVFTYWKHACLEQVCVRDASSLFIKCVIEESSMNFLLYIDNLMHSTETHTTDIREWIPIMFRLLSPRIVMATMAIGNDVLLSNPGEVCMRIVTSITGLSTLPTQRSIPIVVKLSADRCVPDIRDEPILCDTVYTLTEQSQREVEGHVEFMMDNTVPCDGPNCNIDSAGVFRLFRCGGCKGARYCSVQCQKAHWDMSHKKDCKVIRTRKAQIN
jgi:hypothetical protein